MTWTLWSRRLCALFGRSRPHPARASRPPLTLEMLEGRALPSTLQALSLPVGSGSGPAITAALGPSSMPSVSANGQFIAYQSEATNLVSGQSTSSVGTNVFLLDQTTGTNVLVSHAAGSSTTTARNAPPGPGFTTGSWQPQVSADGNFVAFSSDATDLVPNSDTLGNNVYLWDRQGGGQVTLVSHAFTSQGTAGDGYSQVQAISSDGQYVLYKSSSGNLVNGQVNPVAGVQNEFLYNRTTQQSVLVSHTAGSLQTGSSADVGNAALSADGHFVAFVSGSSEFLYDVGAQTNVQVATGVSQDAHPALSADGGVLAYVAGNNVYRYTRANGMSTLVSHASGSPGTAADGTSGFAIVSADGNFIAYNSTADNLVQGQTGINGNVTSPRDEFAIGSNVFLYDATQDRNLLVSHVNGSATQAAGSVPFVIDPPGTTPLLSISQDGRFVAYQSQAANVVAGQSQTGTAQTDNIFLFDRLAATPAQSTLLVSGAGGSSSATGNASSSAPLLTPGGDFVVFTSLATNLNAGTGVNNGVSNVWVHDVARQANTLASHSDQPTNGAGAVSVVTSTSDDGRFTVFQSTAINLVPGQKDDNFDTDVFLFDKKTGTRTLISHVPGQAATAGNGGSSEAVISRDGNFIAFRSEATNLVTGETPADPYSPSSNVFLYNRVTGEMILVSHAPGSFTTELGDLAGGPAISARGDFVAFLAGDREVYLFNNSPTRAVTLVSHAPGSTAAEGGFAETPAISDDGRFIAYAYGPSYSGKAVALMSGQAPTTDENVYVFDRTAGTTGTNTLVSHAFGSLTTPGNAPSHAPALSADGGYVAFVSFAGNLVSGQNGPPNANVFLYQVANGAVTLVSGVNGSAQKTAQGDSVSPAINADGSYVAFVSPAPDLVAGVTGPYGNNIYEYSRATGTSTLVSHAAGARLTQANGFSSSPVIDADGSLVAYLSQADNLVPGQVGGGIDNVFVWDRLTQSSYLASGRFGSYTVISNAPSFQPVLSRHSFPYFSSTATDLVTGVVGTTNAFVNSIIQARVTLGPVTISDGTPAGTVVATFSIIIDQGPPGQLRLPTLFFDPTGADNGYFSIGPVYLGADSLSHASLAIQYPAAQAVKGIYAIGVDGDLGLGDLLVNPFTLTVTGGSNPPPPPPPPPPPLPPPPQQPPPSTPGGFESLSIAFDPSGQEVTIAVQQDGSLVLTFAGQATVVPGTFQSASVAFSPSGQGMLAITEQDGTLILADATGPHVIPGSFQSASVGFSPSGQMVLAITEQDGTLILADSSGPHVLPGGFQSASVAFSPSGQEDFAVVLGDGTLLVADASGPHTEPGRFRSASLVFDPFGREVLSSIRDDGSEVQF